MIISKTSSSVSQNLMFTTIKDMEDYIVITYPIGFNLEIKGNFIHVRNNSPKEQERKVGSATLGSAELTPMDTHSKVKDQPKQIGEDANKGIENWNKKYRKDKGKRDCECGHTYAWHNKGGECTYAYNDYEGCLCMKYALNKEGAKCL